MKIVKTNPTNPDLNIIKEAVTCFKKGGIIVYPTDTCYAIGADIHNKIAFEKIYTIKKRPKNKPLSVIVSNISDIYNLAVVTSIQEKYIKHYFPGQITLIFLTLDQDVFPFNSIGIRIPNYNITKLISEKLKHPYVTTSANISDYPPAYEVKDFIIQLHKNDLKPNLILDVGKLNNNKPSTVIDLTNKKPQILRQGSTKFNI